jgi:hypothetical protein
MTAVTYYQQAQWHQPHHPPRPPSAGAAVTTATLALLLAAYTAWPSILLIEPLIGSCGDTCFAGFYAVSVIGFPLAGLLLLTGAILIFARTVAGPVMTALGATVVLALMLMSIILSHGSLAPITLIGLVLSLPTVILSLLPPTFAWTRKPAPVYYPRY